MGRQTVQCYRTQADVVCTFVQPYRLSIRKNGWLALQGAVSIDQRPN